MTSLTRREWLGLAALILAAGALRFAALRDLPPALWYDEAINGLDAWGMLRDSRLPLFFDTGGHPREPLFIWLVAAMVGVAGPSPVSLRVVSAIIGVITVAAFWWMLRGFPREDEPSSQPSNVNSNSLHLSILSESAWMPWLAAAALMALRWHVHFSRTSFRTIMTPLMIILAVGLLMRAMRSRRLRGFIAAGAVLGLGFYTYLAFRFAPFIVAVALLHPQWRRRWRREPGDWKLIGAMMMAAVIVLAPLLINYARHPEHFSGRMDQVTLFSEGIGPGLRQVGGNALQVAGMFSWPRRGDHVPKHNIPNAPVFGWPTALFFYLGIGVAVWRARRRALDAVMLMWLLAILQASVWSFGAPNLLRTVGATPAVAYFLAVGWLAAVRYAARILPKNWDLAQARTVVVVALAGLFLIFAVPQTVAYFHTWARDPRVPRDFSDSFFELALLARQATEDGSHVILQDELYRHPTVEFMLLRAPDVMELKPENLEILAAAWRDGAAPFGKPGSLLMIFAPTGSPIEQDAVKSFRPTSRQSFDFFPVYIVPERPSRGLSQ